MATNPRDLLIRPVITEKTSVMMQDINILLKCLLLLTKLKSDKW